MNIALQLAEQYITEVYPPNIPPTQRLHVTQAFMAGMLTMQLELRKLSGTADEAAAVKQIEDIEQATADYFTQLRNSHGN